MALITESTMSMLGPLLQIQEYPCTGAPSRPLVWLAMFGVAWLAVTWVARRKKRGESMKPIWNVVVVALLAAGLITVFALKQAGTGAKSRTSTDVAAAPVAASAADTAPADVAAAASKALPRLVDLGSDTCIPCKMMMPVLEELRKECAGRLSVEFYDVRKDPSIGAQYGIRVIPTQVFYDTAGKEVFRHEGFFSKEDILAKWKESGLDLAGPAR
jgi:thioredoxin 1